MIDFSVPEEITLVVDTVRRFIENELVPLEQAIEDEGAISQELTKALLEKSRSLGLYAMNMPESVGGAGLSAVAMCLVEEQFGWTTDVLVRRTFGAVPASLVNCTELQRQKYLEPAVRGDIIVAFAMSESAAGSDAAGIQTTAVADGDGFVLNGSKHFISDADLADAFIVTAITDPALGKKGISTFLVDRDAPGFTVGRVQKLMGLRGLNHSEIFFDTVRVSADQLLGKRGDGLKQALGTSNRQRLGAVGARSVGMASRLLQMSIDYARERKQFGEAIANHQLIQAMLADMATDIYATRLMVLNAAWEIDQDIEPREKVSMVKLQASEMLGRVADRAVQIFGGMGYCSDIPVERHFRDARVQRILDGTSEIHRLIVARGLISNGLQSIR